MQRFAAVGLFLILLLSFGLSGCGGRGSASSGNTTPKPASVTLAPDPLSLERGAVFQISVSVKDAKGNTLFTTTPTFASSNPSVLTVSTSGLLCAGTWDSLTAPIVCTPATGVGASNLTATAGGITSSTVVVSVHDHVDNITLSSTIVGPCTSQNLTQTFTATASSGGNPITDTVGTFSWFSTRSSVATIDVAGPAAAPLLTANQASVKAGNPGLTNISASISGTNSVAAPFITCSPATISIDVPSPVLPDTSFSFSIATNLTKQLEVKVVDTQGVTITGLTLTWNTSQPAIASVSSAGLVTGVAPGVSTITASCTPASCNPGVDQPIYSNPVTATVTVSGTGTTTTVYATTKTAPVSPTDHTDLIPIDTSNNPPTAGTAIALPTGATINSLLINPAGTRAYLGSSQGLVVVDVTNNTVVSTATNAANALGKALTVSPNGQFVITSDTAAGKVYVYDSVNNSVALPFDIAGATHASFTPDSFKAYIVGGIFLYQYSPSLPLRTIMMSDIANDVAVNSSGQFAYVAGGEAASVAAHSTCRTATSSPSDSTWMPEDVVGTGATPNLIASASTGDLLAVEGGSSEMDKITPTITDPAPGASCPPTLMNDALSTASFGVGPFTPRQIIVTPDGSKAYVTSNQASLLVFNNGAAPTTDVIPLANSATAFTGGALIDSSKVYVGGSDNKVHVIDVATGVEGTPISLSFTPDLVAVRPH